MNYITSKGYCIVSKNNCRYCTIVKQYLSDNFNDYCEVDASELREEDIDDLKEKTNHRTYPFIFLDGKFIGGHNEFFNRSFLVTDYV